MHRTVTTINRILFLPSKTDHPRSTHPAVTFIWRVLHIIFMVDLAAWPPPPNDPRTNKKFLHEVCPTHSHRQETSPDDSASTFHIPSTKLKLHDIVRICLHHHHIEEDELEASHQEKKDCLLLEPSAETARVQSDAYREHPDDNRNSKFSLISNASKFQFFGDNQPGPKFQPLLQPMIPQLQPILEIPCSNPSPTPSTNFTGRRIVVMF
jgi:hypothetical protein